MDEGKVVDAVKSYFGMRKIEVRKDEQGINRLMLNQRGAVPVRAAGSRLVARRTLYTGDG